MEKRLEKKIKTLMQKTNTSNNKTSMTNKQIKNKITTTIIIRAIIKHIMKWLNSFPVKGGISETLSPRKIMTNRDVDFNKDCQLEVGCCVQAHKYPDPTNNPQDCMSVGAIANQIEICKKNTGKNKNDHTKRR